MPKTVLYFFDNLFSCIGFRRKFILDVLYILDFGKNDVHIRTGDVLAVDDLAVLAQLGPVFAVHFLACRLGVTVDSKLLKGGHQLLHVCAFRHLRKRLL